MKRRLGKAMPHVPLLKLKPDLATQIQKDQKTNEDTENDEVMKGQGDEEANDIHNTACEYDSDVSHFNCVRRILF